MIGLEGFEALFERLHTAFYTPVALWPPLCREKNVFAPIFHHLAMNCFAIAISRGGVDVVDSFVDSSI